MFYKRIDEIGEYIDITTKEPVNIIIAENTVMAPDYTLDSAIKDTYSYPVDGWYWFDTNEEMLVALNVEFVEKVVGTQA